MVNSVLYIKIFKGIPRSSGPSVFMTSGCFQYSGIDGIHDPFLFYHLVRLFKDENTSEVK